MSQYLWFSAGRIDFVVPAGRVEEVGLWKQPELPEEVAWRESAVPVIDVPGQLGLEGSPHEAYVMLCGDPGRMLVVSELHELLDLDPRSFQELEDASVKHRAAWLEDRGVMVLLWPSNSVAGNGCGFSA